jgi:hypothetical protein
MGVNDFLSVLFTYIVQTVMKFVTGGAEKGRAFLMTVNEVTLTHVP